MKKIYETAIISKRTQLNMQSETLIGDLAFIAVKKLEMQYGSQIAPHAILSGGGEVVMEPYSVVGFAAQLITGTDTPQGRYMCEAAPEALRKIVVGSITLNRGAYIGSGAIICVSEENPHIAIGAHSVVGALSYIDRSIEPYTIIHPKIEYVKKTRPREV